MTKILSHATIFGITSVLLIWMINAYRESQVCDKLVPVKPSQTLEVILM